MIGKYKNNLGTLKILARVSWVLIVLLVLLFEQTHYVGFFIIPFLFIANIFIFLRKQI